MTTDRKVSSTIHILVGDEVSDLLTDNEFSKAWDALYRACSWATPFQSKAFVATWYKVYARQYIPILVKAVSDGNLTGLLTLAKTANVNIIHGAGLLNAEYHAWLATESDHDSFITSALREVQKLFPDCIIELRYIPANTSLKWAKADRHWRIRTVVRAIDQPVIALNQAQLDEKLNTRAKRKMMNRLRHHGELRFERITDQNEFISVIDGLIDQSDFRKAALYNKTPFRDDPLKKELLLSLFEQELLHLTVLKLDQQIIASKIITVDERWGYLKGILTHSPHFARQSPGLLHSLMLARLLAAEGRSFFDLTPGGDQYKDQLATDHASVYHVWIVNSTAAYLRKAIVEGIKKFGRALLATRHINTKSFKTQISRIAEELRHKGILRWIKQRIKGKRSLKSPASYLIRPEVENDFSGQINIDSLKDLLLFEADEHSLSRWEFMSDAMKRMEMGEHVFSVLENGRLAACAWQGSKQQTAEATTILTGLYCHASYHHSCAAFLKAVARKLTESKPTNGILTIVNAEDLALNRILSSAA